LAGEVTPQPAPRGTDPSNTLGQAASSLHMRMLY
jgi:hypothetical protein